VPRVSFASCQAEGGISLYSELWVVSLMSEPALCQRWRDLHVWCHKANHRHYRKVRSISLNQLYMLILCSALQEWKMWFLSWSLCCLMLNTKEDDSDQIS